MKILYSWIAPHRVKLYRLSLSTPFSFFRLSVCLRVFVFVCLCFCLSVCLLICVSACLLVCYHCKRHTKIYKISLLLSSHSLLLCHALQTKTTLDCLSPNLCSPVKASMHTSPTCARKATLHLSSTVSPIMGHREIQSAPSSSLLKIKIGFFIPIPLQFRAFRV